MTQLQRKQEFYRQLTLAKKALKSKSFQVSFYHLENAHILGQKHVYRHTLSHYWMLVYGIKTNSSKEIIGQLFRIIASILFTLIWVPTGNTGGTNISAVKPIPIRKELQKYF
ncbi:DUF3703 domain-containing protein [Tenacibaculum singaporense]|uniref:DUF3703 domain-containing protein n=1 Tax=Tenacibaculum singaporense TaxID=2358479 RepID=A0A3Q8RQC9_9FLAO|nr:DUF3703 domain-containing protein [Tenacibaculum singaporense]AZJ36757.1 DUF3703 domain-containing protein [Tenacibaculum singaporense]